MSTSWGGLKRFRVKGAFLKSPLSGPGQTALVAPAGAKSPAGLKITETLPKRLITNRFVSILIKSPLELLRGWDKIGIGTSLGRAAPFGGLLPLAAIQQTNGLRMMAYPMPKNIKSGETSHPEQANSNSRPVTSSMKRTFH